MAVPGFPRGGGATPRGVPTYDFVKISQKVHEIERNWTSRGGGPVSPAPPLDLPLTTTGYCCLLFILHTALFDMLNEDGHNRYTECLAA